MGMIKGLVSLAGDIFGVNLFRKKEDYLFGSDHFGLVCELSLGRLED